jgi:hypothetical protein
MRYILNFIFLIISISSIAQDCKLEINDIDPRTKLLIKRTEFEQLARVNGNPFLVKGQSVGDQKFIKIRYYRYNNFEIRSGSEMEFMLTDNKAIKLKPFVSPADTVPEENSFMTVSSLLIFPVEAEDFEKLSSYNLRSFKFYVTNGYVTIDMKEKKQAILREVLNCIK